MSRTPRLRTIKPPPPPRSWLAEIVAAQSGFADPLWYVLWRALRNARLWADAEPEKRGELFSPVDSEKRELIAYAQAAAPELAGPLGTFGILLSCPQLVLPEQLADACHAVYKWANARGLLDLASHFAEAAATADPMNPTRANDAGRSCRRAKEMANAGAWFERGFGLAVRAKNRGQRIRAMLGYGAVMKDTGRHEEARRWFGKAARSAARSGRDRQAAEAHHDLMTIAAEIGTLVDVEKHARRALTLYPEQHAFLPALPHDLGFAYVRLRHYTVALPLIEVSRPRIGTPSIQALVWSTLAWAAAGAGRFARAREAEGESLQLVGVHDEYAPAVMLHLAEAMRHLGEWSRAEAYAAEALKAARKAQDPALEDEAEALTDQISARIPAPVDLPVPDTERAEQIARWIQAKLRKWKAPGRRGRPGTDPGP